MRDRLRMLVVAYSYGIRSERKLCEEVELHLAYRWFCRLALDDKVPHHSTFSVNRHGRFRDSDLLRQVFEAVVRACMDAGLVKGEGFAVDARSNRHSDSHRESVLIHSASDQLIRSTSDGKTVRAQRQAVGAYR